MASGDLTATSPTSSDMNCSIFDGIDDYVDIPHNEAQLGVNLSQGFTISAWINPRSLGEFSAGIILDKSSAANGVNGFAFRLTTTTKLNFRLNSGTSLLSADGAIALGTWKHVLVTISSAQLVNFYSNGVLSGTANQNLVQGITAITTTNAPRIGNRATATDISFDGSIRKVKMWNRVLTTTEITADYNGQDPNRGHLIHEFLLEKDYKDTGRIGVDGTASGTYFNKTNKNALVEDIRRLNLTTVTDKLKIIPKTFGGKFTVVGVNRAP